MLPALESGGVERGTVEVAGALVAAGHRALVMSAGGRLVEALASVGGEHVTWPVGSKSPLTLALVPRLRAYLERGGIDVVHARSRLPAWVAYLAWRKMPVRARPRFVTTVHGLYSVGRYSAVMVRGERVEAVSETVRAYIEHHYPWVEPERVRVNPRGVDPQAFPHGYRPDAAWRAAWESEWPDLAGKAVLSLPGRITRLKGHEVFLDLVDKLVAWGYPVHGVVAGGPRSPSDAYAAALRRAVAARGVPVAFAGHRDDLREVLSVSDVVLSLSTRPESFGRTTLEALTLGLPVVGFDHGGVGEVLRAVFPAGAVPVGDVTSAARRVAELIERPVTVPPTNAFPLDGMLERTLAIYEELAAAQPRVNGARG
jgi:glycosyltransferase involved in cell wall biosynthesis